MKTGGRSAAAERLFCYFGSVRLKVLHGLGELLLRIYMISGKGVNDVSLF